MQDKNNQNDLGISTVGDLIKKAINRLPNGDNRLLISKFPLNKLCLKEFGYPNFNEQLGSDYGLPSDYPGIEKEFFEELALIEKILGEINIPNKSELSSFINRRSYAMQIWDCHAIPWRFRNDTAYIIWSPNDLYGTPLIHSYSFPYFLQIVLKMLEERHEETLKQTRHLKYWRIVGILALIIIGFVVWAIIEKLLVWR